jgi:hypothetical protein
MLYDGIDDQYPDEDFTWNLDPNDENWEDFSDDEDIPEEIEWLEEVDNEELDDYSFEDDYDDIDLEDL